MGSYYFTIEVDDEGEHKVGYFVADNFADSVLQTSNVPSRIITIPASKINKLLIDINKAKGKMR